MGELYRNATDPRRLKTEFKKIDKPSIDKIPYISHAIWITNPDKPREMLDNPK